LLRIVNVLTRMRYRDERRWSLKGLGQYLLLLLLLLLLLCAAGFCVFQGATCIQTQDFMSHTAASSFSVTHFRPDGDWHALQAPRRATARRGFVPRGPALRTYPQRMVCAPVHLSMRFYICTSMSSGVCSNTRAGTWSHNARSGGRRRSAPITAS